MGQHTRDTLQFDDSQIKSQDFDAFIQLYVISFFQPQQNSTSSLWTHLTAIVRPGLKDSTQMHRFIQIGWLYSRRSKIKIIDRNQKIELKFSPNQRYVAIDKIKLLKTEALR